MRELEVHSALGCFCLVLQSISDSAAMPTTVTSERSAVAVHRVEVRPRPGVPASRGAAALREANVLEPQLGVSRIDHAAVYLIEGALATAELAKIADELLADPVLQQVTVGAATAPAGAAVIEVHPLPGVTDPAAASTRVAIAAMLGVDVQVRTGHRWDFHGIDADEAERIAARLLANPVIHAIHRGPHHPEAFAVAQAHDAAVREVPLRELDDVALERMSRDAHLFLSLDEMRAVRDHYRALGREPREIELETIAQTWSEHCVHKTFRSTIRYREEGAVTHPVTADGRAGHVAEADGSITISNLLKSTIAAATFALIDPQRGGDIDWCLSVFVDNAGVIAFDDDHAVCFKCETHNHPSAIEPYGGAATGIGGCIRDIMGTGLAARPIAATDVFCVANPDLVDIPAGCLHPQRILRQVVAGVRDYGNRMGIPTLNGAVWFDDDHVGNPLVYCGCIGVMPRDMIGGAPRRGDRIVAIGGRTGRDGIHGATFSSAELTDAHADEFSHAVQIGDAITQKKALDAILALRDHPEGCAFSAITDCGAGGFSSAVGEMGRELGADVHLDRAPLKYAGLSPTEVWISEAQERMVLAVPPDRLHDVERICAAHEVEWCDLGTFGSQPSGSQAAESGGAELVLRFGGDEVGRLSMDFLHDGVPMPHREARFVAPAPKEPTPSWTAPPVDKALVALLGHPNIASKHWIIRQYDHEVQGGTVIKPLVGVNGEGPSDGAVVCPVPGSSRGLAIANGLATGLRDDPYLMALAAVDECVRNLVCVGADPSRIAVLDNFSWPGCGDPQRLAALVRAAEGCRDAALAYRAPFVSGKDSLNNQFVTDRGRTIAIPPTLLISGMAIVDDIARCVTSDAKEAGNALLLVGPPAATLRGSHFGRLFDADAGPLPETDLAFGPTIARAVASVIRAGLVRSAHDLSDGGLLVAVAEALIGGELGAELSMTLADDPLGRAAALFGETPSRYLLEVREADLPKVLDAFDGLPATVIGRLVAAPTLTLGDVTAPMDVSALRESWLRTLDW